MDLIVVVQHKLRYFVNLIPLQNPGVQEHKCNCTLRLDVNIPQHIGYKLAVASTVVGCGAPGVSVLVAAAFGQQRLVGGLLGVLDWRDSL